MTLPASPPAAATMPDTLDPDAACAEALLAGTLALMTGHAQACCDSHREAMARKIVVRLQCLGRQPGFTPHFRTMLAHLHGCWMRQAGISDLVDAAGPMPPSAPADPPASTSPVPARPPEVLWHAAPEAVQ
ncbi:hypothetical protein ACFX58_05090 [Sphingomonas sp. NCPPB 2930]